MDFIWILFAFTCGIAAKTTSLPPSIGYLFAGFLLHFLGFKADAVVGELADLGITLMLFTIGLKLNISDLLKKEVWASGFGHNIVWLMVLIVILKILTIVSIPMMSTISLQSSTLIVFALSFSSTVCVVKLLEENGEMRTRHGKLAIGILVIQDLLAVAFLVISTGKLPETTALFLLLLFPLKPFFYKLVNKVGHGELIPLTGFFVAFGAYELFEVVQIKGDLGALLAGMYLANHSKSSEITKSLLSFKDLFLIGFFLSIGFTALPTWEMFGIATLLALLLPVKFALFFGLFIFVKLRARTAFLASLALANYSEFGLIVTAMSLEYGWLTKEWMVILSLAVSLSFVVTSILYNRAHQLFTRYNEKIKHWERVQRLPEDVFIQPCDAPIVIVGMGRVGMGAYKALEQQCPKQAWGLDSDIKKIQWLTNNNIQAFHGDAEDIDFWENIELSQIKLALLALPSVQDSIKITQQLKHAQFDGKIAAIARYDDERKLLESHGVDKVFNFYNEAGVGFAEESIRLYQ